MKLAIVGNCQCESFAVWARQAIVGAEAGAIHLQHLDDPDQTERVVALLAGADLVASQHFEPPRNAAVLTALQTAHAKTRYWPGFGFDGFHPDTVYLRDAAGKFIQSPMGDYNSKLIAAAFVAGRTRSQARALFNSLSYHRLNFFNAYPKARAAAAAWLGHYGVDGAALFERWDRKAPFMHTVNHPALWVVAQIAGHVLSDMAPAEIGDELAALDPLSGATWPVYPELARAIGVDGGLDFVRGGADGVPRIFSLDEMIEGSFDAYAALPPGVLGANPEVQTTLTALRMS